MAWDGSTRAGRTRAHENFEPTKAEGEEAMFKTTKNTFVAIPAMMLAIAMAPYAHASSSTTTKTVILAQEEWLGTGYEIVLIGNNTSATLHVRYQDWGVTWLDEQLLSISVAETPISLAKTIVKRGCEAKGLIDTGTTIAGCTSVAATGACFAADPETVGALTPVCIVSASYAVDTGWQDCVEGISSEIAQTLNASMGWSAYATQSAISQGDWSSAVSSSIDFAICDSQ